MPSKWPLFAKKSWPRLASTLGNIVAQIDSWWPGLMPESNNDSYEGSYSKVFKNETSERNLSKVFPKNVFLNKRHLDARVKIKMARNAELS